jgi:hypothetical protein
VSKLKREALRLPGFRQARGYAHHAALEAHSTRLPALDPRDLPILEALRRTGAQVVAVEEMGLARTPALFAVADTLVAELKAMPTNGDNAPRLPFARLMSFPDVYMWGLEERLLNLIENYIGLPIRYHGIDVRREVADGAASDVRQWHIDTEDHRLFRIIMYLNDVEAGGGPFEYIPREQTVQAVAKLRYGSGFVKDDAMQTAVARTNWIQATARARCAAFADTCRVFHRAQAPTKTERYSITFSWMSTTPVKTYPSTPLPNDVYALVVSQTNERQRAVLPPRLG